VPDRGPAALVAGPDLEGARAPHAHPASFAHLFDLEPRPRNPVPIGHAIYGWSTEQIVAAINRRSAPPGRAAPATRGAGRSIRGPSETEGPEHGRHWVWPG
jgi:hypothetical protein